MDSDREVQLVSDQEIVKGGDSAKFHILYHSKSSKTVATCKLKVTVPAGLSVENDANVEWDAEHRIATWTLTNVEAGGARVLHFKLKVDASAKVGSKLPVAVAGISDNQPATASVDVPISVGAQIKQPLFIGFPDRQFRPGGLITRAEAAAVAAPIKELPAASASTPAYSDVSTSHWAYSSSLTQRPIGKVRPSCSCSPSTGGP